MPLKAPRGNFLDISAKNLSPWIFLIYYDDNDDFHENQVKRCLQKFNQDFKMARSKDIGFKLGIWNLNHYNKNFETLLNYRNSGFVSKSVQFADARSKNIIFIFLVKLENFRILRKEALTFV